MSDLERKWCENSGCRTIGGGNADYVLAESDSSFRQGCTLHPRPYCTLHPRPSPALTHTAPTDDAHTALVYDTYHSEQRPHARVRGLVIPCSVLAGAIISREDRKGATNIPTQPTKSRIWMLPFIFEGLLKTSFNFKVF